MDNFSTLPKVMGILWWLMIVLVCTVIFFPGWPGQNVKEMNNSQYIPTKYFAVLINLGP